jgi:hypothetical protein
MCVAQLETPVRSLCGLPTPHALLPRGRVLRAAVLRNENVILVAIRITI